MKKILVIAIAAAIVAPMAVSADTTVYGRINNALVSTDRGTSDSWDIDGQASRFGVKGSEDLGNGLKAIFQYEWSVDSSDEATLGGRLAFVGLTGGFGTVAIGRQWTPYYGAVDKTDIFNLTDFNSMTFSPTRTGNALAYVSPNFSGFSAALALVISGDDPADTEDTIDAINLSLNYNNGPLSVGFGYHDQDSNTSSVAAGVDSFGVPFAATTSTSPDVTLWGLSGKYNFGAFAVIAQYEELENGSVDSDAFSLAAEAYFGNNTVRALYGERDVGGVVDQDQWAIGIQHNFSKRTRVYAEYGSEDDGFSDIDVFGIGLRHDF